MSPVRTVYVPRFSSQPASSQRDEPQPDHIKGQTPSQCQRGNRGNKRGDVGGEKSRSLLKVKFPKLNYRTLSKKPPDEDKTPSRWMFEPAANKTKTTVSRGGETQCAGTDSDSAGGDGFFFSQRTTSKAINQKKKAKHAVLRTISRMLEENQLIRQRLAALSQAN